MFAEKQRAELCKIARMLYEQGLVSGTAGNLSVRLDEKTMLITPSGVHKGMLAPEDLIVQNFDLTVVSGMRKPTKEAAMHSKIYELRPDIEAVLHTHPAAATAFAVCGEVLPANCLVEVDSVIGSMGLAGYAPAGSRELVLEIERVVPEHDVIFLQNHGLITCGKNLMSAFCKMESVENAAKTLFMAERMGRVQFFRD